MHYMSQIVLLSISDSCERGWKLLVICTGYLNCSELLLPYLISYLQANSSDSKREFHGITQLYMHIMYTFIV